MKKVSSKYAQKLASSDLDLGDAKLLHIKCLAAKQTKQLFAQYEVPSLQFVYHNVDGTPREDTYRVRLLEAPVGSFGEVNSKVRYLQPPKSPPAAYLPQSVNWEEVASDPSTTIVVTEGELKAACAAKHGYKCIGLGGVSSWRSGKRGWTLLPELTEIDWVQRDVVICFDSDINTNPNVAQAAGALSKELTRRGALPRVAILDDLADGSKAGIDDFILEHGIDAFHTAIEAAVDDELARKLWEFNSRFTYVMDPGIVFDDRTDQQFTPPTFRTAAFANIWAAQQVGNKVVQKQVATEWITWPHRRQVARMSYSPGQDRNLNDSINVWKGWGCESKSGDVTQWVWLLDLLFEGASKEARDWFERWCLYPIKNPGVKQLSACCVWSRQQGVGKSMVGDTLSRIYGDNYSLISQKELDSEYTGWQLNKQFVMVDDISSHGSRAKADTLKKIVTQTSMFVNIKHIPTYFLDDCVSYYLTSNRPNALYIEDLDRRYFVHEVKADRAPPDKYVEYLKWLDNSGAEALRYYAENHMDFGDYSPYVEPPMTASKIEMIGSSKSELMSWLFELRENPENILRMGQVKFTRDIWTSSELSELFDLSRKGKPVTSNVLGICARDYFSLANKGKTMRVDDKVERFFIIRNWQFWKDKKTKELVDHVRKERAKASGKKY
jgi:hypothetical protein